MEDGISKIITKNLAEPLDSIEEETDEEKSFEKTEFPPISPDLVQNGSSVSTRSSSLQIFMQTDQFVNLKRKMNIALWEAV